MSQRARSIAARLGAEEFVILMPDRRLADACQNGERVRHSLSLSSSFILTATAKLPSPQRRIASHGAPRGHRGSGAWRGPMRRFTPLKKDKNRVLADAALP